MLPTAEEKKHSRWNGEGEWEGNKKELVKKEKREICIVDIYMMENF